MNPDGTRSEFPAQSNGRFVKLQDLRYGENPHQSAAFYRDLHPAPGSLVTATQLQGKELSYNNIADADAAWECVKSFDEPACVIVKHANPCGVAVGANAAEAYAKAFKTDPTSAFGGIIAFNCELDGAGAALVAKQFVEVLMAPSFTPEALALFAAQAEHARAADRAARRRSARGRNAQDIKRVGSGLLIQSADNREMTRAELKCVTTKQPTPQQLDDLLFAWKVAKYVKSNAIVFCGGGMTLGVGAGQMSRVDSARIASIKAAERRPDAAGLGGRERRVLPVPRRPRRGDRRRRDLRDPAGRLDARRRGDQRGRRARHRDGVDRRAPLQALNGPTFVPAPGVLSRLGTARRRLTARTIRA